MRKLCSISAQGGDDRILATGGGFLVFGDAYAIQDTALGGNDRIDFARPP